MIKNLSKYSIILCLISLLQGCGMLSTISSMLPSSSPGISVDAQIGDKSVDLVGKSTTRDIILDDGGTVTIDSRTTNTGISPFWLILCIVTLQIPQLPIIKWWKNARSKSSSKQTK